MRARIGTFAALLTIGTTAIAEPPKSAPARPTQSAPADQRQAPIVLASAEAVHATAAGPQAAEPAAKRRVAPRVTTCRCGDPQVGTETQDQ